MTPGESIQFNGIAATTAGFSIKGGIYGLTQIATGAGSIMLQNLAADGSTWVNAMTAITTTTNTLLIQLPPGQYRFLIATFTAIYLSLTRVPE